MHTELRNCPQWQSDTSRPPWPIIDLISWYLKLLQTDIPAHSCVRMNSTRGSTSCRVGALFILYCVKYIARSFTTSWFWICKSCKVGEPFCLFIPLCVCNAHASSSLHRMLPECRSVSFSTPSVYVNCKWQIVFLLRRERQTSSQWNMSLFSNTFSGINRTSCLQLNCHTKLNQSLNDSTSIQSCCAAFLIKSLGTVSQMKYTTSSWDQLTET